MEIRLIDVQCGFGGATPGSRAIVSASDLLASMARLRIEKALVRITPEKAELDIVLSNEKLVAACRAPSPQPHERRVAPRFAPADQRMTFSPSGASSNQRARAGSSRFSPIRRIASR